LSDLVIDNSSVERQNLIVRNSYVDGQNLILGDSMNYVKRFSPEVIKDNKVYDDLYETQKEEISTLHSEIRNVSDNAFIKTLTLSGIQNWEKFLGLKGNSELDFETRKQFIWLTLLFRPPFTRLNFQQILETIWGKGNFVFTISYDNYEVVVDIDTNNPKIYLQFQNIVRHIVPANIYLIFAIQYTYLYLNKNYTYADLTSLDYNELSRYANL